MNAHEIAINSLAQGVIPLVEGQEWFASLPADQRKNVLDVLCRCIFQAHPTSEEVDLAIAKSGVKSSMTPCVMLQSGREHIASTAKRVVELPEREHLKAFSVLLALFTVADERRRNTQCLGGCSHEWHNLPPRSNNLPQADLT